MLDPGDTSGRHTLELCVNATEGDLQASDCSSKTIFVSFLRNGQDRSEEITTTEQPSLLLEKYPSSFKYSRPYSASFTFGILLTLRDRSPHSRYKHQSTTEGILNAGYILRRKPRLV